MTTVLDIKINDFPTHAASLPVAMIPNCAATRHVEFTLDGTGTVELQPPSQDIWPEISSDSSTGSTRVNIDRQSKADLTGWKPGDRLLISGSILTGRDAAHKRIANLLQKGQPLPDGVDFTNRFIYYVGPVDAVGNEVVGPAGPTTSTRMDKFSEMMLGQAGLMGMIGKAERGAETCATIKQYNSVYLIAVGGAAYLVSKAIKSARIVAFEDLGIEAIREFEVVDMPVMVAVSSDGESIHQQEPEKWKTILGQKSY